MAGSTLTAMRYLGLAATPAARTRRARPPHAAALRAAAPARRRRIHPLRWLGLAEQPVRLEGHPRIRERVLDNLQRRRRRDSLITASIGTLLAMALLTAGVVRSPLLGVEAVTVVGLDTSRQLEVAVASHVAPGTNVLDVDLERVRADVEGLPWVATATVHRRLPSTVEIRVAARTPVAVAVHGDRSYLLDGEGVVLGEAVRSPAMRTTVAGSHQLPTITVDQAPTPGRTINDQIAVAAARVAAAMPRALDEWIVGYTSSAFGEIDATMRIDTGGGPADVTAHLGRPDEIDTKAATLAALVHESIDHGIRPLVLDVRIPDRPVVRGRS